MPGRPGRYVPLLTLLEALPANQSNMRLTFAELETRLDGPLPPSAQRPDYWTSSPTARTNWQRVGWSAQLYRAERAVVFTRQPQQC
jgi:hypothetical protein